MAQESPVEGMPEGEEERVEEPPKQLNKEERVSKFALCTPDTYV